MLRRSLLVAGGVSLLAVLTPVRSGSADPPSQPSPVAVTNFPTVQPVSGRVTVTDPIPQTRFETRKALVPTAALADANHWTEAGAIDCAGFTFVTLSLGGGLKGAGQAGSVGVVLLPDVPDVLEALRTYGVPQFPLSVEAAVPPTPSGLFSSESKTFRLAFPRYRVFLYNSTQRTAEATVYALLGTS
jgi:hypothetical protein